eukprot:PhF_6_TR31394/c0_g2_i1/m.45988/K06639/CDC14; cell division cycle 14
MELEITQRFTFAIFSSHFSHPGTNTSTRRHYFTTDHLLHYEPFFNDFGPYNLAHVKIFISMLESLLDDPNLRGYKITYYVNGMNRQAVTNGACLVASYCLLRGGMTPSQAYQTVQPCAGYFIPFHDASPYPCTFDLTVKDIIQGFARAISLGWYDYATFDVSEYQYYEQLVNGDFNWIIPQKMLAFSGPGGPHTTFTAEMYSQLFRRLGVTTIVRLNQATYDAGVFCPAW